LFARKPRRRPSAVSLSMTSMIDVLVVLTVFLLITFEASPHCHASTRPLPMVENHYLDVMDAPLLVVQMEATYLDGTKIESPADLVAKLKARRAFHEQLAPGRPQSDHVLFAIDADVPSRTVKAMVKAAADGGYPSIDFMVQPR
jgi:biopolymer transport protein ExbD